MRSSCPSGNMPVGFAQGSLQPCRIASSDALPLSGILNAGVSRVPPVIYSNNASEVCMGKFGTGDGND